MPNIDDEVRLILEDAQYEEYDFVEAVAAELPATMV